MSRRCKDCNSTTRKLNQEGPRTWRCASCQRARKRASKAAAHEARVQKTYGLPPGAYDALYAAQGGSCFVCRRATGAARKLSVDHDHRCCPGPVSCGRCVRALVCRPCNDLLGHVRGDTDALHRAIQVLRDHPAQQVLLRF